VADVHPPGVPPRSARLKYYLLSRPPDELYRGWVEKDLTSGLWLLRAFVPVSAGYLIGGVLAATFLPWDNRVFLVGSLIGLSLTTLLVIVIPPWRRWMNGRRLAVYEKRWAKQRDH
jgi:hypothetical protein